MKTFLLKTILLALWTAASSAHDLRGSFDEDIVQEAHWSQSERNLVCRDEAKASCNPQRGIICCGDRLKCKRGKCKKVECEKSKDCAEGERCRKGKCKDDSRKNWFSALFKRCKKGEVRIANECVARGKVGDQCIPSVKPCDRANFCLPQAGVCVPRKLKPCLGKAWKDIKENKPEVVEEIMAGIAKQLNMTEYLNSTGVDGLKTLFNQYEFEDQDDVETAAHLFCNKEVDPSVMDLLEADFTRCMTKELDGDGDDAMEKLQEIMSLPMVVSLGISAAGGKFSGGILKDLSGGQLGCFASGCEGASIGGDDIGLALGIYFVEDIAGVEGATMDFDLGKIKKKDTLEAEAGVSVSSGSVSMLVSRGDGRNRSGSDPAANEVACFSHVAKRAATEHLMEHVAKHGAIEGGVTDRSFRMLGVEDKELLIATEEEYGE